MKKLILIVLSLVMILSVSATGCSKKVTVDNSAQGKKISQYSNPNAFITPNQLKAMIDEKQKDLVIIGVLDPTKALIPGNIASTPIEGSYAVWRPDYSGKGSKESITEEVDGFRKSKEAMEELLSKAGATANSKIVVYAADAHHDAARLFWQIRALGHKDVRYLDGGLNAWVGAGYKTDKVKKLADEAKKSDYKAPGYNAAVLNADVQKVVDALNNPKEWVVIDTRSKDEYDGKKTGSSKGAFGTGRLKGTVHIEWTTAVVKDDTTLKSLDELKKIYGDTIKGKKVITLCQSGVRSAHTYMVLVDALGAKEIYNYDGSWIEWSYIASEVSKGKAKDDLRAKVLGLTELWSDSKEAIK